MIFYYVCTVSEKALAFFLIILMEHSSAPFKKVSPHYIHNEQISYDSGAEVTSLIKTKYIS